MEREGKVDGEGTCGDSSQTERLGSDSGVAKVVDVEGVTCITGSCCRPLRWRGIAGTAGTSAASTLLREDERPREEVKDLTRLRKRRSCFLTVASPRIDAAIGGDVVGVRTDVCESRYKDDDGYAENSRDGVDGVPLGVIEPLTLVKKPPSLPRDACGCVETAVGRANALYGKLPS